MAGAWALTCGVCVEGLASRLMTLRVVSRLRRQADPPPAASGPLTYRRIARFYLPLALTSTLALAVHPMVTFFVGQSRMALESLAVLPVVNGLTFVFRCMGLSFQEVAVALFAREKDALIPLTRFALLLAAAASAGMALVGWTPMIDVWYGLVSGLSEELTRIAVPATRILCAIPALAVLLSFERAILVHGRRTAPITNATAIEIVGIVIVLAVAIHSWDLVGATAAAIAVVAGRLAGNLFLLPALGSALRGRGFVNAPER
jgi:hypothetical protein